jgi:exosortase
LRNTPIKPDIKGLFILISGVILLLLGNVGFEPFVRSFSMIITIMGLIYFILGSKMLKEMLFPVAYLLLMIPLPYIIIKTISVNLRLIDATATYSVLNFLGMPILQDGVKLELLQMSVVVADLCTGILSLVAIMAIAVSDTETYNMQVGVDFRSSAYCYHKQYVQAYNNSRPCSFLWATCFRRFHS